MKFVKRLLAVTMAASMLLSTAFTAAATDTAEKTEFKDSSISDLMNVHNLNPLTGNETEPFNAAPDASILMTKENELLLYSSNVTKNGKDAAHIFEKMDAETSYALGSAAAPELGLSFVTAVALNAAGNGTDDHVAYLGVKDAKTLRLVLYNARKSKTVASIYRICDNQDPVQVNNTILPPTDSSFVDTSTLKPGKIYTYYVVARYENSSAKYLTMNSKSSTVVWGIPQTSEGFPKYTGSMLGSGSMPMVIAMAALGISVPALGIALAFRKKQHPTDSEDDD